MMRGIRGATVVARDEPGLILEATRELLLALVEANRLRPDDIASAIFTATPDLTSQAPARAARELGWTEVALLDAAELPVSGSLPRCIRVLLHIDTERTARELVHVYLRDARILRPDR